MSQPIDAPTTNRSIQILPEDVVNRIAAGEVVQRPASVVKELIENSLDANSNSVDVVCVDGGMRLLSITDDGNGIQPIDLPLACRRFATSKLVKFDDLKSIQTFGFRGEALASASMVSRMSISSKLRPRVTSDPDKATTTHEGGYSQVCAYKMSYLDGAPTTPNPTPCAGNFGTIVKVEDLFYNVPHRKRAFQRKQTEEYNHVLKVCERYAIHMASRGVVFVCRKKTGGGDLNTKPLMIKYRAPTTCTVQRGDEVTKEVIGHVFGSSVAQELLLLECGEGDVESVERDAVRELMIGQSCSTDIEEQESINLEDTTVDIDEDGMSLSRTNSSLAFKARGFITNGSYSCAVSNASKKRKSSSRSNEFVLFINNRLVECSSLKRTIDSVYMDILGNLNKPPFVYLSLTLPGPHVDVNVHPTKREVALLHEGAICDAMATATRAALGSSNASSRTFFAQQALCLKPKTILKVTDNPGESKQNQSRTKLSMRESHEDEDVSDLAKTEASEDKKSSPLSESKDVQKTKSEPSPAKRHRVNEDSAASESDDENSISGSDAANNKNTPKALNPYAKRKTSIDPKKLVRTSVAAPAGALEPYLVSTQKSPNSDKVNLSTRTDKSTHALIFTQDNSKVIFEHEPSCEFAKAANTKTSLDLSVPGAFASICRCVIRNPKAPLIKPTIIRPKKVVPTSCSYSSIQNLRNQVVGRSHREIASKLRDSTYVGCISRHRSLLQWGIELVMINHYQLGRELFYQLALMTFGGARMASLGKGINVKIAIRQALSIHDEDKKSSTPNEKNILGVEEDELSISCCDKLAQQAGTCLEENAEMLMEYFSIKFSRNENDDLQLVGLPILLDGHSPSPHAVPIFLLRLATEVNWDEEEICFANICAEIGSFYAEIPLEQANMDDVADDADGSKTLVDEVTEKYARHVLFPALSYLLVPPSEFADDRAIMKLALLPSLYKVFERC